MSNPKNPDGISGPSKSGFDPGPWYWNTRKKRINHLGTALFTLGRLADLPLQYWLLRKSYFLPDLIAKLGGTPVPLVQPGFTTSVLGLGLSPYQMLIMGLATGSSLKQIYWKLFVNDTNMTYSFNTIVCVYNTLLNTFNTGLAFWSATSQQPADQSSLQSFFATTPITLPIGITLYSVGLFIEWYCELQRKAFKSKPENKDKPYSDGLFGLARNINYGGYTLWRMGYSLICGGLPWAIFMAAWLAGDFCGRAIPSLDAYCEKRVSLFYMEW